jgi:uncharacterized membrane protein YhaH (DUF805 family)|tara:strand:- start:309 stop:653 length:345 start_codon:yes stop_codon:yes gene_type:complete
MQNYSHLSFGGTISGTSFFLRLLLNTILTSIAFVGTTAITTTYPIIGLLGMFFVGLICLWYALATIWKRSKAISPNQSGLVFAGYLIAGCFVIPGLIAYFVFVFMNSNIETHNG